MVQRWVRTRRAAGHASAGRPSEREGAGGGATFPTDQRAATSVQTGATHELSASHHHVFDSRESTPAWGLSNPRRRATT